ncbi:hypothetical protein Q5P01_006901 [Channa striata]|uniref:Uncharacterized protein n=1 Tax=Channa striata TaxID=64152 RepID=A0AA88T4U5_CHASR|nr:hypothetical protein Q5P01_006901 [Channa striata]
MPQQLKTHGYKNKASRLFTTTSSAPRLHSYSAPGTPAAIQQSKQSVIPDHLLPREHGNEAGMRVEGKEKETVSGGRETGETEMEGGRRGRETCGTRESVNQSKRETLAANTSACGLLGTPRRHKQERK